MHSIWTHIVDAADFCPRCNKFPPRHPDRSHLQEIDRFLTGDAGSSGNTDRWNRTAHNLFWPLGGDSTSRTVHWGFQAVEIGWKGFPEQLLVMVYIYISLGNALIRKRSMVTLSVPTYSVDYTYGPLQFRAKYTCIWEV